MAKKKYIDATEFANKLRNLSTQMMYVPMTGSGAYYGSNGDLQNAMNSMIMSLKAEIGRDVGLHMSQMLQRLAMEVDSSAIDGGQCLLCQQRDGETMPDNNYYGCGTESAAIRSKCG
jgi:hypothetical protein